VVYIDLLITNCPNLEELKFHYLNNCDKFLIINVKNIINLKVLYIESDEYTDLFPSSILPEFNLEKLEISSYYPLKINFDNFVNIKKLKFVKNIYKFYNLEYNNENHK
jgi:hypothetical protein